MEHILSQINLLNPWTLSQARLFQFTAGSYPKPNQSISSLEHILSHHSFFPGPYPKPFHSSSLLDNILSHITPVHPCPYPKRDHSISPVDHILSRVPKGRRLSPADMTGASLGRCQATCERAESLENGPYKGHPETKDHPTHATL